MAAISKEKHQEALDQIESTRRELQAEREKSATLNAALKDLERELFRINEIHEADSNPKLQTIEYCSKMLSAAFSRIQDPITAKESFKQFIADVIAGEVESMEDLQKAISKAQDRLQYKSNIYEDITGFTGRLLDGKVVMGNRL